MAGGAHRGEHTAAANTLKRLITTLALCACAFGVVVLLSPQVRWEIYSRYYAYSDPNGRAGTAGANANALGRSVRSGKLVDAVHELRTNADNVRQWYEEEEEREAQWIEEIEKQKHRQEEEKKKKKEREAEKELQDTGVDEEERRAGDDADGETEQHEAVIEKGTDKEKDAVKSKDKESTENVHKQKEDKPEVEEDVIGEGETIAKKEEEEEEEEAIDDDEKEQGEQRLTKSFLMKHATNNRVIVTWANFHYLDFVLNWVYHMRRTGATNFVVGAMDPEIYVILSEKNIPTFAMSSGLTTGDFGWGTPTFHKMGREKIRLVKDVTAMGVDLLLSDVDTVWLRNPNEFMDRYPDADVLTSSDHGRMTTRDGGLELYPEASASANIGIMLFSHRAKKVGDEWMRRLEANEKLWDQQAFNDIMREGFDWSTKGNRTENRLFTGFNGHAIFGVLPVSLFCSGHNYFVQDMPAMINAVPYVMHATFQYGGTPGKRNRFRERLLWDDPIEYFTRPGGYLAFEIDVPDALLHGENSFSLEGHFRLVHFQLRQIRSAMAVAELLGRALVMPKIYCQYDRFWAPIENGRFGSTDGPPDGEPFLCPMDHVFDMERMKPGRLKTLEWREYSFLENPRLPNEVLTSAVLVGSAKGDEKNAGARRVAANTKPMDEDEVLRVLGAEDIRDVPLIKLGKMDDIWAGFTSEAKDKAFVEYTKHLTAIWCCVRPPPKKPGHIWYDIWFDRVPHTDRHNRLWTTAWNATMLGP